MHLLEEQKRLAHEGIDAHVLASQHVRDVGRGHAVAGDGGLGFHAEVVVQHHKKGDEAEL